MESTTTEKFEAWGLLELFGHQRLAGKLSEQSIGGCHFIRIDVPQVGNTPAYSRFFTQGAIYGMTPMDEGTTRKLAAYLRAVPVQAYELRSTEPPAQLEHQPDDPGLFDDDQPWPEEDAASAARVECGGIYEGPVTQILDFGAVVRIAEGVDALLHISAIAHHRVENVRDYLAEGQVVRVKVIETDERGRVKVSMKALQLTTPPEQVG